MGLYENLSASLKDQAIAAANRVKDGVLLHQDLNIEAEDIASRHALRVPSLGTPETREPYAKEIAGRQATGVDTFVPVNGEPKLFELALGKRSDVRVDHEHRGLVVTYAAEKPNAEEARRHFDAIIGQIRTEVQDWSAKAEAFNKDLQRAVFETLWAAKKRAEERRDFGKELRSPTKPQSG
jgi:hypothetical protein